jgi:hypothetical protein
VVSKRVFFKIEQPNPIGVSFNNILLWITTLTFLSGALRKWVFTSGLIGNLILFVQLLLPFIISVKHNGILMPTKQNVFKIYFLYLLITAFNPMNLTIFHGLIGIIQYLGFWWFLSYYFENRNYIDVRPLFKWMIFFCMIEIFLGFIQYQLPQDHILNKYAAINQLGEGQVIAKVGSAVRITGTFSYISGFSSFLIFLIFFIWTLIRARYNKNIIAFLVLGALVGALMSGSRTSVFTTILILALILFSEFNIKTIADFGKSLFLPFLGIALFISINGFSGIINSIENAFVNFDERRTTNAQTGEQNKRLVGDLEEIFFDYRGKYPFFGVGLGSTYQGATSLFGTSDYVREYGYYEGELPRIILEAGFTMLIFRIALFFWLISWLNVNLVSKFVCFFLFVFGIGVIFNIYNSIFLALGLIFLDNISINRKFVKTF